MSATYQIAPVFLIRIAGVPFESLEALQTTGVAAVAREMILTEENFERAKQATIDLLNRPKNALSPEAFHELRRAVRNNGIPQLESLSPPASDYTHAVHIVAEARDRLSEVLDREVAKSRAALLSSSREYLPRYLVFGGAGARQLLGTIEHPSARRNKRARERERHLLLYLQRIAGKNDTFSEFGPSSWGGIDAAMEGVRLTPVPGIAKREAFWERWVAHFLAAAINSDPQVFPELRPRLNPNGLMVGNCFIFGDSGEQVALTTDEISLLGRCDGTTPVYELAKGLEIVPSLAGKKIVIAALEVPALDPYAFDVLQKDVASWRAGPARDGWLPLLQGLSALAKKFASTTDMPEREQLLVEAQKHLSARGAIRKAGQRSLYSALNPIAEECFRRTDFTISDNLINEVPREAERWIDFWRDSYAFVASRVATGLQQVLKKIPAKTGAVPLPAFLRACETGGFSLVGPGLVGLAHLAFQEIKTAFRERMKPHAHLSEYQLSVEDCHIVRKNFEYPKFDEFTWPSADLQLAAGSAEAISRGDYQWILSELHPPAALLHHGGYWSCPSKAELHKALSRVAGRAFHFGFFAADFTAHTAIRIFDAIPEFTAFVAPQRADPRWKHFPPAQTEVYLDEGSGDVRLRHARSREDLGSFARNWIIPLGFHPFQFGMSPQMPRLCCGRVIVQRRAWAVSSDELGGGNFSGISRELVIAVEKLRAEKDWPRFIYIRPTEQALRRSGAEGRDKDTKPVFIDLESYLFLEIFHRWLTKAGELEITEMLPAPNDLWWKENDGRRTFELRTLIVPSV